MSVVSNKRRVCIVSPKHWSDTRGGAEYQAERIANRLVESGRADVAYLAKRFAAECGECIDGYRCVEVGSRAPLRAARGTLLDVARLWSALRRMKPDVIYQRVGCAYTGVCGLYAKTHGIRFVWHVAHDYDVTPSRFAGHAHPAVMAVERSLLNGGIRRATRIIAQTRQQSSLLATHFGRHNVEVIPNAHEIPECSPKSTGPAAVVWVANLKPVKRPDVFVRLAQSLSGVDDTQFVMVGAPSWDRRWQESFEQQVAGVPNLTYLGERPQEEVNHLLATARIFVSTSEAEGFPNTFIQAWMRAIPVVSYGSNPDGVLSAGQVGYVAATEAELAERVKGLLLDDVQRERLGATARVHAIRCHGPGNLDDVIKVMLDGGP